ncbi:MAG: GntR family transcriptional regulator [Ilumatobacter sp.]|jgi:GntR family transcriptional regulator|uniref:GntR family transcriptional regulator n=1 Tax=Ilumatobacter sp. TaxID=1967498 RepID=UPI00391C20EC
MTLDRSSPMPLWAQLEALLKRRLESGEFNERFPTDTELVNEYGVSRHTVREAIRHLNRTGILRRERGRGTVVNRAEFEQPLGALYSLFQSIESSGVEQRSEVLALREETNDLAAEQLGLATDTPLVFLERIRCAGGEPLAIDRTWVPASIGAPLLASNFERTALYDEMERLCGVRPNAGWERIAPLVPTPSERDVLQLRRGQAAFFIERLSTAGGAPIEWRTTTVRGDRYRFVSEFEAGSAPALVAAARE